MCQIIYNDLLFTPYMNDGYQCKIPTKKVIISVRYKGANLIANNDKPFEVWYPDEDSPTGYQNDEDVYNYIKDAIEPTN